MKLLRAYRQSISSLLIAILAFWQVSQPLQAATILWDNDDSDNLWNSINNWSNNLLPTSADDLNFLKPFPGPSSTITLGTGEVANSLFFGDKYTLTGGDLALTSGQIAVTIGNSTTIESKLTGSGGLLKQNDGALILTNAANDYTGTTQIDAGSVIITDQGALGTDTSAIIVTGNATRAVGGGALVVGSGNNNLDGLTFTRDLALTGGGASGDGAAFNSVGNNIFTGNIVTGGNPAGLNPVGGTAITASATRLASTFGTATLNGGLTIDPSGQNTEFTGNGNWLINSNIDGAGNLVKSGNGLMVLTGNNTFGGVLQLSGGYVRVSSEANLGSSLANNGIFLTNSGRIEFRTDTPDFTTSKRVQLNTGTTTGSIYLDREIGGSGLNQTVNLGLFTLGTSTSTRTLNIDGRNGYNLQFNGNMASASQGSFTINNTGNGLFTNSGNFWGTNNTTARTLTFANNGDFLITGGIIATGAAHVVTKTGTGTLTLRGTNSSFSGNLNVNGGTVAINDFRAITNNTSVIDIGTGSTTATFSIIGNNLSGANVTTSKVVNLGGTTGGAIILANQTGTSPGVRFNADFTATTGTAANAKTLQLGGTSAQDNTIVGRIPNNAAGGAVNLTKIGSGTWVLAGANTYTGTTTITAGLLKLEANAAVSTILPATNAITFSNSSVDAGGALEFLGQAGVNNVQALGTLAYASSGGAATIRLTPGLLGTASLAFDNIATGGAGTVNFVGGDFTNNTFTITNVNASAGSDGILTRSVYWNGADFAYRQGGVLRAPVYGVDAGTFTSGTVLGAGNNEITGSFSTGSASISTLKINGGHTLTIDPGETLTLTGYGLLATGGNSTITGGVAFAMGAASQPLVVRVDGGADSLRIETAITGSGGLTKSGAGVLVLAGANSQTGAVNIGEGTLRLAGVGVISADNQTFSLRQGAILDLNGVGSGSAIGQFNNNGTVTNTSATDVTLSIGNGVTTNGTAGTAFGIIEDGIAGGRTSVSLNTNNNNVAQNTTFVFNGLSTYTGSTTLTKTAAGNLILNVPILANIGEASSIGAGDSTSDATNAASLVFSGAASATQIFATLNYNGSPSLSTDRLFTFGGSVADSGVRIRANGVNDSTLIWSNLGALAFGTPNIDQGLALGGASIGSNQFNPLIADNGTGVVSVYKQDAGLWILGNNANSYTGITRIDAGALRGEGTTLPGASPLVFNGGVFQSGGTFTRSLNAAPTAGTGGVNWAGNGGFAAASEKLTVNIGGNIVPDTLQWATGGFVTGTLILSSTTAFAEVDILNSIDLNGAVRTVQVDTNGTTNSDLATLSGVLSGGAGSGLLKTGTGILRLLADNTFAGNTAINNGTVRAVSIGNSASLASNFGDGTGKLSIGTTTSTATLAYVGGGETTDRLIEISGTSDANSTIRASIIESSGTGPLILNNVQFTATGTAAGHRRALYLRGDSNVANEITNALSNNGANSILHVTKDDNGTWILSGQSTFTGNTTVSAGPLGIGADSVGAVGAVTSSPVGTTRLIISNGSVFALNGDRTINTLTRFNGNASSNFIGVNSLTFNDVETTSGGNTTVTNMLPTGKFLTINSPTFSGTEATTARTFVFNGPGDTILNASVTNGNGGTGGVINLTYQGYGSLTLGGSNGASTYTGNTTISSGTLRLGSADAIPNGVGAGSLVMNPAAGLSATLDLNGFSQTVNALTANSAGSANIDNSSASPVTFTFGSQDSAANLIGAVTNSGGGALSINKIGTGAATMNQGPFTYTGSTTVAGGSLIIASDVTSTSSIVVGAGALLAFTEGLSGSAGVTSIDVGAGGELRFLNSSGEPLSNLTSLILGAGSTLGLNAGAISDTLTLLTGSTASVGGAIGLRIRDTGSMLGSTTYELLKAVDGGLLTGGGSSGSYSLTAIPGGFTTLTLNQTDTLVSLTTGTLISDKRYWTGATSTIWNDVNGTFDGLNWSPDKSGATTSAFVPGSGTTVVFSADNAVGGALVTTLEQGFRINALEFESSATTATSVAIDPGTDPLNRLIISPASSADGINLKAGGPGVVSISAPLRVDVDQTWTVADSTSTLTLSGGLSGPGALTTNGLGTIFVTAAAGGTFAVPTVLVNGGTLEITNAGALGTTVVGNAAAVTVNPGAAFYYNGASATVNNDLTLAGGTLSGGGGNPTYSGSVLVSADSFINMRDSNGLISNLTERTITLTGQLSGTGKLTLDSTDELNGGNLINGLVVLSNDNSGWSGGVDLIRGTLRVQTNMNSFGTGDVTASAGRIQFNLPANNTLNLAQNFTVDSASGGLLELSVDAQGTLSGDLTVNVNGVITLGASSVNGLRLVTSTDNFSVLNITNSIVLANDASISFNGSTIRTQEISAVISEIGGSRALAINDDLGGWAQTNDTIRLSGANTFTGDISFTEGVLEFSTVSNIGGPASNLGQGSGITLAGGTFSFIGDTNSQSTDRVINQTGAATFAANGTNGATITYSGAVNSGGNTITLTGTGEGFLNGTITQTGTAADINVNSGIWHLGGTGSTIADDVIVTGTSTGTAVLNLDATGTLSWTAGTSNGLYARDGGVINLNADDVNGVGNSGGLSFILLGDTPSNSQPGTLNTNGFNITTPRLDVGGVLPGRTGIITGSGTITGTYTGTDWGQGFRFFAGSITANLAGDTTILKQSLDPVTLSGDNSGLTGAVNAATRIDSGTLILDYTSSNTTKLNTVRAVDLRGGMIQIVGNNSAATSQDLASLTLGSGGSSAIQVTGGTGQEAVLNLGAITRGNNASDGTMRFILPAGVQSLTNGITTTSPNSNFGLLGNAAAASDDVAYATVDDGTGVWFATKDTAGVGLGNIIALISSAKNDVSTWLPGDHVTDETTGYTGTILGANINSLRFDSAAGSDLTLPDGGILTVNSGGILLTSNVGNSPTIIGGTLSSLSTEIVIHQNSASTFEVSSDIRVNHALTKTGPGTLLLTGNNVYTGETEIQEGTLQVNGTSIGDTSPVNLADDHVNTLQLLNSEAIGRLTGGSNAAGLDELATVDIGANTLTINSGTGNATYAGKIVGSGVLVKNNSGTNTNQLFTGVSTGFNGTVIINGGLLYMNNIGSMNATDYIINSGGSFLIDNNGTTTTGARILDTATITLNSADGAWAGETRPSGLAIRRDQNSSQSETVGVITARSGASYVRLDASSTGTSSFTEIIANNIVRQNNATLNVRGTNLGNSSARRARFRINDATNQANFIAAMIGGGGATGTDTQSIVPWAIAEFVTNGSVGDGNMGNSLATYVSGQGFRALNFATDYTTIAGAAATNNARESLSADLTGLVGTTINALVLDNAATATVNVTGTGPGQALTNTSGAFLFTISSGVNSTGYSTILGGFDSGITVGSTNEYVFTVQNPSSIAATATLSATVDSPLTSTADITKSGRGTLIFTAVNTAGGGTNKTTLNEGTLEIAGLSNIGGATGDLVFAGGTLRLGAGFSDDISTRSIFLLNAGGTIDTNGNDASLANSIGFGLGGITKVGAGNLTLNAAATYTGPTVITGGTLTVGANDATGLGGDVSVGAGATLDVGANSITAGLVSTSGAAPTILGTGTIAASTGFFFNNTGDITVAAVLSGSGGLLKTQTNVLTLSGLSTYTGTTEIQNGTVSFDSIGNVGGGASALGAPTTVEDGIIRTGLGGNDPVLTYTGSGHSTDRIIEMQGIGGGNLTINADGTGALALGSIQTATGGNKTLTLSGVSTLDNLTGFINEVGSTLTLQKAGSGTWLVNTVANYTGATQINEGTLKIGVNDVLPTTTAVRLGTGATAGTLDLNGFNQTIGSLTVQSTTNAATNNIIVDGGNTLTISGAVTLGVNANASTTAVTASGGGSIVVNSGGANFQVGGATGGTNDNAVTADFTGLSNFTANLGAGTFRLGDGNTGTEDNASTFKLAVNNSITAANIRIGDGTGGAFTHTLTLGSGANALNANTFNIGSAAATIRSGGAVVFDAGDTTGTLTVRASDGSSRALINMINTTGNTAGNMDSILNLTGHTSDILASTLSMATRSQGTGAGAATLSFDQGTLDVTTLNMASRSGAGTGNATATVNLGDSAAPGTPTVAIGTVNMAVNTSAGGTVLADLNITGGTVTIGTGSGTAVNMANAGTGRTVTSNVNLTGGTVNITGNIVRTGGAGTENATVTLNGSTLDMMGNSIGETGKEIAFVAESGSLTGLAELNGGALLTKTTTGVLTLGDGNNYTGGTTITGGTILANNTTDSATGSGAVQVDATGTLGGNGEITVASGGSVTIDGTLSVGQVGDASGVDLALGVSGGGNIILNGTASFDIFSNLGAGTLNGATASDLAVVSAADWANVVFGGSSILQVTTTLDTSSWVSGDSWRIFDWTAVGGTAPAAGFASFDLPSLSGLLGWDTSSLYDTGVIAIVVVPEPSRALLLLFGLLGLAMRRRRVTK